jgi:ADP-ribose pyrophosphatase YjhB (NUDIX family)
MEDTVQDTTNSSRANGLYAGGQTPAGRPRSPYAQDLREDIRGYDTQVGAVLITNAQGQILVGFNEKRQVWDVPQGTVELLELPLETAVRELAEETNIAVKPGQLELIARFKHCTPTFVAGWETFLYAVCVPDLDVSGMRNMEEEKCKRLAWYSPCQLPSPRGLSLRTALVMMGVS